MVGDVARNIPWINTTLDSGQAEYQPTGIELEAKQSKNYVSILVDLGASFNYISPKLVELSNLPKLKFKSPWLVQLATVAKRRVVAKVVNFSLEAVGQKNVADLNILPFSAYGIMVGMD